MINIKLMITLASVACLSLIGFAMSEHDYKNNPEYWQFKATLAHKYKSLNYADGLSQDLWNESLIQFMQHKEQMLLAAGNEVITIIDRKGVGRFHSWTINLRENRMIHSGPLSVKDYRQTALKLRNVSLFQLRDRTPGEQASLLRLSPLSQKPETLAQSVNENQVFHNAGNPIKTDEGGVLLQVNMPGLSPRSEWPEQTFYYLRPLAKEEQASAAEERALEYFMCKGSAY